MLNEEVITYIENLLPERPIYVQQMEEFAKQNDVPIMVK